MSPAHSTTAPAHPPAAGRLGRRAAVALATAALLSATITAPAWAASGPALVRAPGAPIVPPPPTGWPPVPARGTKAPTGIGHLTTRPVTLGTNNCTTTFDEDPAIDLLPNDALDTFVVAPWWNQQCAGDWIRIYPSAGSNHYHLIYTDADVTNCLNADNDHDTPLGQIARGAEECEPIDPVTEPRSYINTMIGPDVLTVDHVDGDEPGYPRRPFTLRQITIKNHAAKLCFKLGGAWEAAEPPAEGEVPGTFCWDQLDPAAYDLTSYTEGSMYVTVTLADPDDDPNFGIDTVKLNW